MTSTVHVSGPFERLISFRLEEFEIEAAKGRTARALSREMKIPGFRPGKAPQKVVEAAIGASKLRSEAIELLVPERLAAVLDQDGLAPVLNPTLERMDEEEGGVEVEVRVTLWPTLDMVPSYRDRLVEVDSPEPGPDELDDALRRAREQFATLETVDRPATDGDFVSLDLAATLGVTPVEGSQLTEYLYEVGSGQLVEGLDDQLRGRRAGETKTFLSELPDGFGDRAGTHVEFTVVVNEVKERVVPALTDEFVLENTEFESAAALEQDLVRSLGRAKLAAVARQFRRRALDQLISEIDLELPRALVEAEADGILHRLTHRLGDESLTIEDYLRVTGQTERDLVEDALSEADHDLRARILLEAVAKEEGLEVSREEVAAVVEALASASDQPEKVRRTLAPDSRAMSLAGDILRDKALRAILAGARPVDHDGNPVELDQAEVFDAEPIEIQPEPGVVEAELVAEAEPVETGTVEAEILSEE